MKRLAVIGNPIGHSLSPVMHNNALKTLNIDKEFCYEKIQLKPDELAEFVGMLRKGEIYGANVTIPYKTSIIKHLDILTKEAELIGAVNTLYVENNKIIGHNTDGIGCLLALKAAGTDIKNKKIAILGAGGAARAISFVLALNGSKEIKIINRTFVSAEALAKELSEKTGIIARAYNIEDAKEEIRKTDILVNCTPFGMKGELEEETIIKSTDLNPEITVMDIVYNPRETLLLAEAKKAGCKTIEGIDMLIYQGAAGFFIWTGEKAPIKCMRNALLENLK